MNLLGFELTLRKKAPSGLQIPESRGGWWPLVREAFTGAWQQNVETPIVDVLSHPTVFACVTLITSDLEKMRYELTREADDDVWDSTDNPAFSPVLRKPNHYQTADQFRAQWVTSKLLSGNTYVLKERDQRGVVQSLYVLDPWRVRPLIAPDGSVFYELQQDVLATQPETSLIIPAREIIHDRFNCFFHPLVGISPLYAAGIPAMLGLRIQTSSTHFFANGSTPGGVILVPGNLAQPLADDVLRRWTANHGGSNQGGTALLTAGMTYVPLSQPADKSQLNEQWLAAAEAIAVCFHVPFFLVGGPMPPYNNVQSLTVQYRSQCLQVLATAIEKGLDEGLGLSPGRINNVQYGVQFKTKDLLLMDSLTMMQTIREGIGAGVLKPNEGRADLNLLPVEGGDTPYLQQQNFSLEALNRRDQEPAPAANPQPTQTSPQNQLPASSDGGGDNVPADAMAAAFEGFSRKAWERAA